MRAARDVKVTLGVGIALMIAVGALTLTRAPSRVVRVGAETTAVLGNAFGSLKVCQANESLPAGVSGVRLGLVAAYGAPVRLRLLSGSRVLAEGRRGPSWTSSSVTVPVTPLNHTVSHVKLCIDLGPNSERIIIGGTKTPAREAAVSSSGQSIGGRISVEYLAAGKRSWWSSILLVARHIGLGHALSGTWVVLLIAMLMAAVGLLAVRITLRGLP
jgi:hypothetical protein